MNTVLLVEDSLTEREFLVRCLQEAGLVVISTTSVEEAHEKLSQKNPDLIILDVILPGQSGFELCRDLKNNPNTKSIPVLICSSKGTSVDKTWGTMLGADGYLTKPVEKQELLSVVRQLLKLS